MMLQHIETYTYTLLFTVSLLQLGEGSDSILSELMQRAANEPRAEALFFGDDHLMCASQLGYIGYMYIYIYICT